MKKKVMLLVCTCFLFTLAACTLNSGSTSANTIVVSENEALKDAKEKIVEDVKSDGADKADEVIILTSLPESITKRGIIIPGAVPNTEPLWHRYYATDCNLKIESDATELELFAKNIGDRVSLKWNSEDLICAVCHDPYLNEYGMYDWFIVYPTRVGYTGVEHGQWFLEDDPGYYESLYYDASGKYMMAVGCISDETLISFLEPETVEVSIITPDNESDAKNVYTDSVVISLFQYGFHQLEATWINNDGSCKSETDAIDQETDNRIIINVLNEYGENNEYIFVADKYLIYNEEYYIIEHMEPLLAAIKNRDKVSEQDKNRILEMLEGMYEEPYSCQIDAMDEDGNYIITIKEKVDTGDDNNWNRISRLEVNLSSGEIIEIDVDEEV